MNGEFPITVLLQSWKSGDRTALDRLVPLVYSELRRMAAASLRHHPDGQTLQPTALVHEAYIRLAAGHDPDFVNRAHFLGVAARLMRLILVDRARARNADKRNAGVRVPLHEELDLSVGRPGIVVALDDALMDLEKQDAEKARILELKYFGGLTAEESAKVLGLSVHQVNREVRLAQAWLRREFAAGCPTRQMLPALLQPSAFARSCSGPGRR